jgi:pyrroline-5-carboxylate reductase
MASQKPYTIAVIGCGTMGVAVLSGVLDAITKLQEGTPSAPIPARLPEKVIACVNRHESVARTHAAFSPHQVSVTNGKNVAAVEAADMVVLACKPYMVTAILEEVGMRGALEGKVVVSILAGVKIQRLKELCPASARIVRAMPNTASKIREGMTVISVEDVVPKEEMELIQWMFSQIGKTLVLPEKNMDVCTAMCGSGPAFYALILEAMADGGVMMGLTRADAQLMAAQTMQGTAKMVLNGQHPAIVREQVSTPGGCTIAGLLRLEDGNVRSTIARTIQEATNVAGGLGKK